MTIAARVVPNVASFSVDEGFWYEVPEHLEEAVEVGTLVRVPLSGRRVRGWVVGLADRDTAGLKAIVGVSGEAPVLDSQLIRVMQWAANYYVAPLSTLFSRSTPPNLPGPAPESAAGKIVEAEHPLRSIAERSASGLASPLTAMVGPWASRDWLAAMSPVLAAERSVLVVAATVDEATALATAAHQMYDEELVVLIAHDDRADTEGWTRSQSAPRLVIGTPRVAAWKIANLALGVVLEESRRAMKDRQTPTIHVRELMTTRARVEGFNLVFLGPTPGVELLASGADVVKLGTRAWPLAEVVDRREDEGGLLAPRTVAALKRNSSEGRRSFVFTHRRNRRGSHRCARCLAPRKCGKCGNGLAEAERCPQCDTPAGVCGRCGHDRFEEMGTHPDRLAHEINRRSGSHIAATEKGDLPVLVGTERDLAGLEPVALAVAADVDGLLMGTNFRTSEDALRVLARLASTVASGSGRRLIVQTSDPDSSLVAAVRRGDPMPFLEDVLVERAQAGWPPATDMLAIELRGKIPDNATDQVSAAAGETLVMGPLDVEGGLRWLLMGDLGQVKRSLRSIVGKWRDGGTTVRIDVDPIDV